VVAATPAPKSWLSPLGWSLQGMTVRMTATPISAWNTPAFQIPTAPTLSL
jgi:hypothetical protein